MDRYQKKCLVGVILLHALPLTIAIFSTAFFNKEDKFLDSPQIIEILTDDMIVTDGPTRGGGSPAPASASIPEVKRPDPIPQPVQRAPDPEPEPEPEPPKPAVQPKPELKQIVSEIPEPKKAPVQEKVVRPTPVAKPKPKPAAPKRNIDLSKTIVRKSTDKRAATAAANKAAQERAQSQRLAAVAGSLKNLGKNLSSSTSIETSGFGGDGQAAINYGDFVLSKYDAAWFAPIEVDDDEAIVKARVVIARNGSVISATIIKASGNAALDKSVRRALELKFVKEFPPGSTDSQRTYIINFNLKSKRGIG